MNNAPKEGWVLPSSDSRKWHYFVGLRALCRRWALWAPPPGGYEQGGDDSPDNCAECKRRLANRQAATAKQQNP